MGRGTVDPGAIRVVNLGMTCPSCPASERYKWLYARPEAGGTKVCYYHNQCGYSKVENANWQDLVRQKISEGYVRYTDAGDCIMDPRYLPPAGIEKARQYPEYQGAGSSENKGGCFIATAAYGAYSGAELCVFYEFRDRVLIRRNWGAWLVTQYYRFSPRVARVIEGREVFRCLVRVLLLEPLRFLARLLLRSC